MVVNELCDGIVGVPAGLSRVADAIIDGTNRRLSFEAEEMDNEEAQGEAMSVAPAAPEAMVEEGEAEAEVASDEASPQDSDDDVSAEPGEDEPVQAAPQTT